MKKTILIGFTAAFLSIVAMAQNKAVVQTTYRDKRDASITISELLEQQGFQIETSTNSKIVAVFSPEGGKPQGGPQDGNRPDSRNGQRPGSGNGQRPDFGGQGGPGGSGMGRGGQGGPGMGPGGQGGPGMEPEAKEVLQCKDQMNRICLK